MEDLTDIATTYFPRLKVESIFLVLDVAMDIYRAIKTKYV